MDDKEKRDFAYMDYALLEERVLSNYILPIRAAEPIFDMMIRGTHQMSHHSRFMNPEPITNHQKKKRDVIKARRAKDKANRKRGR